MRGPAPSPRQAQKLDQNKPGVGDRVIVVEHHGETVEAVGRSHRNQLAATISLIAVFRWIQA
jgi:hypothetical protein